MCCRCESHQKKKSYEDCGSNAGLESWLTTIVPDAGSVLKTGNVDRNESDSQGTVGLIRSKEPSV